MREIDLSNLLGDNMKKILAVLLVMTSLSAMANERKITKAECLKRVEEISLDVERLGVEVFSTPSNFPQNTFRAGFDSGVMIGVSSSVDAILKDMCVSALNE
jgi:hypothetical protein